MGLSSTSMVIILLSTHISHMNSALKGLYSSVLDDADNVDVVREADPNFPTQP